MKFWDRLGNIDRRIIYLILAVVIIVPLILTITLPSVRAMPRTRAIFDHVDQIDPEAERHAILISIDFDPQAEPELKPQVEALVRHAFARDIPVIAVAVYSIPGVDIGLEVLNRLGEEHGKVYGEDYVVLGWKPGLSAVMLGMGNFIESTFPKDVFGTPLEEIPMMESIINYDNIALVNTFTASSAYQGWITYAFTPFDVPVAAGVTSVSVADLYPYLGSKQLVGMFAGLKAAAEYERLVKDKYYPDQDIYLRATQSMPALSAALIVIILFVILGNISFFATRRKS